MVTRVFSPSTWKIISEPHRTEGHKPMLWSPHCIHEKLLQRSGVCAAHTGGWAGNRLLEVLLLCRLPQILFSSSTQGHISRPSPLLRVLRTWWCCKLAPHGVPTSGIHSSFPLLGVFVINILIIQMMVSLWHFHIYVYNLFYSYSPFLTSLNLLPLPLITSSS